jgi:GTP-binding protein EngB required for normal cell division
MRDDLIGLLEQADLALASSQGLIAGEALGPLIGAVGAVRTRLAYPEEVLVVALAGGTGSGKSSLFNVLAGEELVDVGGIRPTTSHPVAAVPASVGDSLDGYLDRLGIAQRHVHERDGLCLIDLPDTDSVELEHRHRVDAMLPLVDVVVWVTDPEKYRDVRLHTGYLKPMSVYADQFLFVMNQIDRLPRAQAGEVLHDLATALESDGLGQVSVIPVAASPPSGPPIGMDRLSDALKAKREARETLYGKLLTDLTVISRALGGEMGATLDFDVRAEEAVTAAAESLMADDQPGAVNALTEFLDSVAADSGTVTGTALERIAADVADHVDRIKGQLAEPRPAERRGWLRLRRRQEPVGPDADRARELLSEAVIRPARALVARRALAIATIAGLAVEVESLRHRLGN